MNRLLARLLRWGLGEIDSRIFLSELDEPYRQLLVTKGSKHAKIWRRKEVVRAVWLSIFARLRKRPKSTGSRKRSNRQPTACGPELWIVATPFWSGFRCRWADIDARRTPI